jgi:hypothetical protein
MAIWPFNRNQEEESTLPEEVQNYYQAEKRERAGVAGLLAVATLLATVLIAVGLFFGGRWVYRAIFDNDDEPAVVQQDDEQSEDSSDQDEQSQDTPASDAPATTDRPAPSSLPSSDTPAAQPTPPAQSTQNTTPATGDELADTGPGDTLAIFIGVVVIATLSHNKFSRQ